MNIEITPDLLGEDGEAELTSWDVNDGATVAEGDVIATAETAKAAVEVRTPQAGVLRQKATAGDVLEAGSVLGAVE